VEAVDAIAHGSAVSVGPMSLQRFSPVTGLRCVPVTDLPRPTALLAQRRGDHRQEVLDFTDVATSVSERNLSLVPGAVRPGAGTIGSALRLTGRERDVLALVAAGLTADAIGRRRGISPGTVRKHLQNVYGKLGVGDRLVAVDIARRHGLLPDGAAQSGGRPGARAGQGAT
jgi:DNA-binding CsgD family transcriptional regulator